MDPDADADIPSEARDEEWSHANDAINAVAYASKLNADISGNFDTGHLVTEGSETVNSELLLISPELGKLIDGSETVFCTRNELLPSAVAAVVPPLPCPPAVPAPLSLPSAVQMPAATCAPVLSAAAESSGDRPAEREMLNPNSVILSRSEGVRWTTDVRKSHNCPLAGTYKASQAHSMSNSTASNHVMWLRWLVVWHLVWQCVVQCAVSRLAGSRFVLCPLMFRTPIHQTQLFIYSIPIQLARGITTRTQMLT